MGLFGLNNQTLAEQDQTDAERKIVSHVRNKVDEVRASANRVAHEGIWMTNIAYLLGYDGVSFNTTTRQFQSVNRAGAYLKKNRIHVNKILPTIQNRLARLCKNPPKYDVLPESNETADKDAARLALQVLIAQWEKLGLNQKRIPLYMWTQECGHAWVKISWDPTLGKPMVDPMTNEMSHEGDVRADVVSPFEIFPDPLAKSMEEVLQSWLIQCKVRKLDYFKTHYPEKGDQVKAEEAWLLSANYEQRINSLNSRGPAQGGMQEQMKNSAIEMIKYEAPSKGYPQGRMIVCANGILLEDKPLPIGEIPFAKFDDIVIGGKFYSESIITHLRPIQDQYNLVIQRRAEWTRRLLAGKYKAARGSGLSQEAMNDESGEIVYYDPVPNAGNGPEAIQIPNIPQYAYNEEDRLNNMLNDISGISEVSRGTLPSASIPAIGMQLLTEQDDTRIGVETEMNEYAWARVGSLILKHVQVGYALPRKIKMAGPGLEFAVKEVSGDMLNDNTDVMCIRGSTLPGSKTLRNQEIMNRYQQGLLGDPMDPKVREKVNELTEFGDVQGCFEDYTLDMAQIQRGIEGLERGIMPIVDEGDNNALWAQELNRYRKGDKFISLPPELQQIFILARDQRVDKIVELNTPADQIQVPGMQPPQPPQPPMPGPNQPAQSGGQ